MKLKITLLLFTVCNVSASQLFDPKALDKLKNSFKLKPNRADRRHFVTNVLLGSIEQRLLSMQSTPSLNEVQGYCVYPNDMLTLEGTTTVIQAAQRVAFAQLLEILQNEPCSDLKILNHIIDDIAKLKKWSISLEKEHVE